MVSPLTNDELERVDREVLWHAFTQMKEYSPFVIKKGEGCWLEDIHGRKYLDGVSSLWCNVHGHAHPELNRAIVEQLSQIAHVTLLGMSCDTTVRLADRLTKLAPTGLNHVFFSSDGASANEVALKMAFQYWQQASPAQPRKRKFLCFEEAYHGDTLGAVSVGGVDRFNRVFKPLLFEVVRESLPDLYRLPPGVTAESALQHYCQKIEWRLEKESDEIAAIIVEPIVQCAAGIVIHPSGFLRALRELADRYNVLLIADEIAVGFGKTGTIFACEQEGVTPDFLCLGKGLTSGYLPMSATLTTTKIWNAFLGDYGEFKSFFHGHTYGGNPVAAAVALETIELFEKEKTLENVGRQAQLFSRLLAPLAQHRIVGDVRQSGLICGIELVANKITKEPFDITHKIAHRVCSKATERGVWLRPLGNVVVVMPPLCITSSEVEIIFRELAAAIESVACELEAAGS